MNHEQRLVYQREYYYIPENKQRQLTKNKEKYRARRELLIASGAMRETAWKAAAPLDVALMLHMERRHLKLTAISKHFELTRYQTRSILDNWEQRADAAEIRKRLEEIEAEFAIFMKNMTATIPMPTKELVEDVMRHGMNAPEDRAEFEANN